MTPLAYGVMMERRTLREEGRIEGKVEGRQEGRRVGRNERTKEIAKKLLKENMPLDFINRVTGMTIEELEKIKAKII